MKLIKNIFFLMLTTVKLKKEKKTEHKHINHKSLSPITMIGGHGCHLASWQLIN